MKHSAQSSRTAADLARLLEDGIHAGRYTPGALLPPVRQHATSLKLSATTVAAAYRLLQRRGLVVGDRRRGTRVREHAHVHQRAARPRAIAAATGWDLASGNPDPALLPPLAESLRELRSDPVMTYGGAAESRELVSFAKGEFAADDVAVDDLLVCNGGLDAIERVLRERLQPGERVALEDPGYPALHDLAVAGGYLIEPVAVDVRGVQPGALERALARGVRAVILTPRAQNPTAAALRPDRAAELRAVLKRHPDVLLIENDPFGPIAGAPFVTLTSGRRQWAIVRSTSKFLGPDLRVALLAGDATTLARVRGRQALGVRWVSHLLQQLTVARWSDPASGRHLARVAETYAHRRTSLVRALAAQNISVHAASGFNLWIPVRHEADVVQRLAESGWLVAPGERFRLHTGPGIRVTASTLDVDAAPQFARALATAMRESGSLPA